MPKVGKSMFAVDLGIAVATGGLALGKIPVEAGEVLYVALDDNQWQMQELLWKIGERVGELPGNLHIVPKGEFPLPLLNKDLEADKGLKALYDWLKLYPKVKLVIIDTWGKVKPLRGRFQDLYDYEYRSLGKLQELAAARQVGIFVVHHTNKRETKDFVEKISGSLGLAGAADYTMVLSRTGRREMDGKLELTGKEIEEQELALKFKPEEGQWVLLGDTAEYDLSSERQAIIRLLRGRKDLLSPKEIAKALCRKAGAIRMMLSRMAKAGEVKSVDGKYTLFSKNE